MTTGRLGYNSVNDRYGLLVSDLWEHGGIHCGAGLEVMVDIRYNRLPVTERHIRSKDGIMSLVERG